MVYSIVITYNGATWVDKCFKSLINSNIIDHHIIAIDNGSTDDTLEILSNNYPTVKIIETESNLGFGKANNIGMRIALEEGADYVFLLNQDAWVKNDTISKLIDFADRNPEYSILSPMHYFNEQILDSKFEKYFLTGTDNFRCIKDVKFVNAALWLVKTSDLFKFGLFNESFNHYGEDSEFCRRLIYHKRKIGILKNAVGYHERSQRTIVFNNEILKRDSNIFFLMGLIRTEYQFVFGLYNIFSFLIIGNKFINRKTGFGFVKRFNVLIMSLKTYIKNRNKHFIYNNTNVPLK